MDLQGKVAIVTGASRGVGAATALMLAERGCKVVCAARATDAAPVPIPGTIDETVRRIVDAGGEASYYALRCDASDGAPLFWAVFLALSFCVLRRREGGESPHANPPPARRQ